jgi:hypothetical protein
MTATRIYKVSTEGDQEGKSIELIAYATGSKQDIEEFYQDRKYYNLFIEEIGLAHITQKSVKEKDRLLKEKTTLEERLGDVNGMIDRYYGGGRS